MARHKRRHASAAPVRVEPRAGGGLALLVGGVTQSITLEASDDATDTATDVGGASPAQRPRYGYWELMLPTPATACPQRALLLGLGGGTIAALLARRCPAAQIVGVERDATVLATAYAELGLGDIPGLTVVNADAFAWVAAQAARAASSASDRYDLICLDLFEGLRLALGTMGTPFLRQVASLLTPDGLLTVNLLANARTPDHMRRLEQVFIVERTLPLYGNRVVHCRRQGPNGDVYRLAVE